VSNTDLSEGTDPLGQAFAEGRAELRSVYAAHSALIYGICRKALGADAAGDVTQDVFVSAWRGREQFDPRRGSLAAWLVGIAKRRIVDHARREQRHTSRRDDTNADAPFDSVPAADDSIDRIAQRVTLAHALATLPERPRQSINLAYVHGLTHDEIAERTGVPLGTIKSDIRRGLLALRQRMEPTDEQ
jgi:RNA polymerase sigma-70 factor (ECF subfamily)